MERTDLKYMRYGKKVKNTAGEQFVLIDPERYDESVSEVTAVPENHYGHYTMYEAQIRNRVLDPEMGAAKMKELEVLLSVKDIEPANQIRFITSEYKTLFSVPDLGYILQDGKKKRVIYLDEYHFNFTEGTCFGCFHICQYAEICERNGITVKPFVA